MGGGLGGVRFLKIFNFNLDVLSIACLTPLDSLGEYVLRVCLMPVLMLVALLVHFGRLDTNGGGTDLHSKP